MKIHIVAPVWEDWILTRIARSFKRRIPGATISDLPDIDADVNFYVNYALYKHPTACDVGFFTHRETDPGLAAQFNEIADKMDGCVAMCEKNREFAPLRENMRHQGRPGFYFSQKASGAWGGRKRIRIRKETV